MNRDRLEHGKRVLARLEAQGVSDGKPSASTNQDRLLMVDWGEVHGCTTVACIAGWFTLDPDFIKQGLTSTRALNQNDFLVPVYGQLVDYGALKAFFDITEAQCDHIFGGHNTNTFADAALRIDQVLANFSGTKLAELRHRQTRAATHG